MILIKAKETTDWNKLPRFAIPDMMGIVALPIWCCIFAAQ
jgi:hypothetical protein